MPTGVYLHKRKPILERFWSHVEKTETCWLWCGAVQNKGYGCFARGRQRLAHRFAYENMVGIIPEGLTIDHLCRNHRCVNPSHLEVVTRKENILRGNGIAAINHRKTYCLHGHPFDETNTHVRESGFRQCRTCDNLSHKKRGKVNK